MHSLFYRIPHKTKRLISAALFIIFSFTHISAGISGVSAKEALLVPTLSLPTEKKISSQYRTIPHQVKMRISRELMKIARADKKRMTIIEAMNLIKKGGNMEQSPTISSMAKSLYVLYKKNTVSSTKKSESLFIMSAAPIQAQNINLRYAGTSQKIVTKKNAPAPVAPAPVASAPAPAPAPAPVATAPAPVASAPAPAPAPVATAPAPAPAPVATAPAPVASAPAPVASAPAPAPAPAPVATAPAPVASAPAPAPAPVATAPVASAPAPASTSVLPPMNIVNPVNSNLKKLAEYQTVMGGFVSDHLMIFLNMPQSAAAIEGTSYYMANIMNEFAQYKITPIFIFEPTGDGGVQLNLGKLKNGDYSATLETLFRTLKNDRGITEDKLGIIVPYPEINTPAFNRANFVPENLPTMVNIFFDSIKKYYPNVRGSLLLDAKSYDIDKSWGQGVAKSFAPYITGIRPGYIESFGLQGFPWVSSDGSNKVYAPATFLPTALAREAANLLGTKKIWLNTGTMKRSYTSNTVMTTPAERTTMLSGIITQAESLEANGYDVLVHIFAQDKLLSGEGIDWSYITNGTDGVLSDHEAVFKTFLSKASTANIKIGLFDN